MKNRTNNEKYSDKRIVTTACLVDMLDIFLNGIVAIFTGSVVMLAETLQGVSDLTVDGLTYIGMKRSKRMPTPKHPLGYGRELYIWSLFSVLIMFFVLAGFSFYFGFQRLLSPEPIAYIGLAYIILIISIITNGYSLSLAFKRLLNNQPFWRIKKLFKQSTFLETKITFTSDLMGVLSAVFGLIALLLFQYSGYPIFDALGAITIACLMLFFSMFLLKNVKDFIIGVSAPLEVQKRIKQAALEIQGVEEILDLKTLVIGSNRLLVNLEIHVQSGLVTEEIEKMIDRIKERVRQRVPAVHHIQIELETPDRELQ